MENNVAREKEVTIKEENVFLNDYEDIVIASSIMEQIYLRAKEIAPFNVNVLIYGETGTGKEELARFIHKKSGRRGEFVVLNPAAIPDSIIESELFGYKKGSFTGALEDRIGYLKLADEGTLFLDEISTMSNAFQNTIIRVFDERGFNEPKEYYAVGSRIKTVSNFRLIAATNVPLEKLIKEKKFREDLLYRLNVIYFEIPPLRERKEEIFPFIIYFITKACQKFGCRLYYPSLEAVNFLSEYHWPGNVRELKNVILKSILFKNSTSRDEIIETNCFREILENNFLIEQKIERKKIDTKNKTVEDVKNNATKALILKRKPKGKLINFSKEKIIECLQKNNWHRKKTAEMLGVHQITLIRWMKKLGITPKT